MDVIFYDTIILGIVTILFVIECIICGIGICINIKPRKAFTLGVFIGALLISMIGAGCSGITVIDYLSSPLETQEIQILDMGGDFLRAYEVTTINGDNYWVLHDIPKETFLSCGRYQVIVKKTPEGMIYKILFPEGDIIVSVEKSYSPEIKAIEIKSISYQGKNNPFCRIDTVDNGTCYIPSDVDLPLLPLTIGSSYIAEGYESETGDFYIASMTTSGGI